MNILPARVNVKRPGQLHWCQGSVNRAPPAGGRWGEWSRPTSRGGARSSGAGFISLGVVGRRRGRGGTARESGARARGGRAPF